MCDIDVTRIQPWLDQQPVEVRNRVDMALGELRLHGAQLRQPLVKLVQGSTTHSLKELRIPRVGAMMPRIMFYFNPDRVAVMLTAGDKAAHGWKKWYEKSIDLAEQTIKGMS